MPKIDLSEGLEAAILVLEKRQAEEGKVLKDKFFQVYESIKPLNLIKSTLNEITHSKDLKGNILNTSMGLATGFLSKKLLMGSSQNPVKKMLGTAIMYGITNVVARNTSVIRYAGGLFLKSIFSSSGKKTNGTLPATSK